MSTLDPHTHRTPYARARFGFWTVAFAFAAVMAFTTVPTPLWSLFAARDHFSSFTVTLVFAVYAVAVAASLFLVGHLSDWHGRRRVLAPALVINILAGVVFVLWPALPGLVVARILSGLGIGAVTATATAWLAELDDTGRSGNRERARIVAVAANLGGLGLGGLISGALAQWVGQPLNAPFLVLVGVLGLAAFGILIAPETRVPPVPRPRYHPQQVTVPQRARRSYFAAGIAAAIAFALFGLVTSLAPSFLAATLHERSHALAGAVSFAMFAAAALAQTVTPLRDTRRLLTASIPALLAGIGLMTTAVWLTSPSLAMFLVGDLIAGVGAGLMFKGAISTATEISEPEHRAEALAGLYLAAYLGLAGPVIGLGALTQIASTRVSLLVFSATLVLGILAAAPTLLGGTRSHSPSRSTPEKENTVMRTLEPHTSVQPGDGIHTIGFVGLGAMGSSMVARLLDAGHPVYGTNRTKERAQRLIERGMTWMDTPREVAAASDVTFSMVTDDRALDAIANGPDGVLAGLEPGTVYVDMSTVSPKVSQDLAARVSRLGAQMLDAPVSGSIPQAEAGTLAIMVGGEVEPFTIVESLLRELGQTVTHIGPNGQGLLIKLAINISLAAQTLAFSEGLLLAERGGVDPELAASVMGSSSVGSPMLKTRIPLLLNLPEHAWFDIELMHKDIRLALQTALELGTAAPSGAIADAVLEEATEMGYGHSDLAALHNVLAQLSDETAHATLAA